MIYFVDILWGVQLGLIALAIVFVIMGIICIGAWLDSAIDGSAPACVFAVAVLLGAAAIGLPSKHYFISKMSTKTLNNYCYMAQDYSVCNAVFMAPSTARLMNQYQDALMNCNPAQGQKVVFGVNNGRCNMGDIYKLSGEIQEQIDAGLDY